MKEDIIAEEVERTRAAFSGYSRDENFQISVNPNLLYVIPTNLIGIGQCNRKHNEL